MTNYLELLSKKIRASGFIDTVKYAFRRMTNLSGQHLGQVSPADADQSHQITTSNIPVPNQNLMSSTGAENTELYLAIGKTWANLISDLTAENSSVLDIGCGCGRVARFLAEDTDIKNYIGFDTIAGVIDWNQKFIVPYSRGKFDFRHLDIYSKAYNPQGLLKASEVRFPADDCIIDLAFAASLFTHLLEKDASHYLAEISRCLKHNGKALISIHTTDQLDERYSGNEFRMEVQEAHFLTMAENADLSLIKSLGIINGQMIWLFQKQ